jgi:hypothetical protein
MKLVKFTSRGKLEKYVSDNTVITFAVGRDRIFVTKRKIREELNHKNRYEYIERLKETGFVVRERARA